MNIESISLIMRPSLLSDKHMPEFQAPVVSANENHIASLTTAMERGYINSANKDLASIAGEIISSTPSGIVPVLPHGNNTTRYLWTLTVPYKNGTVLNVLSISGYTDDAELFSWNGSVDENGILHITHISNKVVDTNVLSYKTLSTVSSGGVENPENLYENLAKKWGGRLRK